mmetsp:Transcript_22131/g.62247  ORF Transcript_22131/g.62247 Transcript_22131/m.62247 type:complete len:231 (+) Transcript_22131:484-1176(+)
MELLRQRREDPHDGGALVADGAFEGRQGRRVPGREVDVGAGVDEPADAGRVAPERRVVEGCRAGRGLLVDLRASHKQSVDYLREAVVRGARERVVAVGALNVDVSSTLNARLDGPEVLAPDRLVEARGARGAGRAGRPRDALPDVAVVEEDGHDAGARHAADLARVELAIGPGRHHFDADARRLCELLLVGAASTAHRRKEHPVVGAADLLEEGDHGCRCLSISGTVSVE